MKIYETVKSFFKTDINRNTSTQTPEYNVQDILTPALQNVELPDNFIGYSKNRTERSRKQLDNYVLKDKYIEACRRIAQYPEVSMVIDEHVNEMINRDITGNINKLDFKEGNELGDKTRELMIESFNKAKHMLDFDSNADYLTREWYIDGALPIEVVYDKEKTTNGILGLIQLSPLGLKEFKSNGKTFYTYRDIANYSYGMNIQQHQIPENELYNPEQIINISSGLYDESKTYYVSYLKLALKPANNLQQIEDGLIVHRILRGSEKRVWNIDVGSMPKTKAESYLNQVKSNISTEFQYDVNTGELHGTSAVRSIMEDYIFPTRNGNAKTSVDTLGGDTNFTDKIDDIQYFRKKLFQSMKFPISRIDDQSSLDFSSDDILREEMKYLSFINKLRRLFSDLFFEIMKRDLVAKEELTEAQFELLKQWMFIEWSTNNHIIERSRINNLKEKAEAMDDLESSGIIGKYISRKYAVNHILDMTDEEWKEQREIIEEENKELGPVDDGEEE